MSPRSGRFGTRKFTAPAAVVALAVGVFEWRRGPARSWLALGPAIGPCCYEVGPEVREAFRTTSGETTAAAWRRRNDRDVLDLRGAVVALLAAIGVERVTLIGPCTKCSPGFCSYRRDGADAGRQVSFIGWT